MFLIGCNDNEHEQFHFIDYYNNKESFFISSIQSITHLRSCPFMQESWEFMEICSLANKPEKGRKGGNK